MEKRHFHFPEQQYKPNDKEGTGASIRVSDKKVIVDLTKSNLAARHNGKLCFSHCQNASKAWKYTKGLKNKEPEYLSLLEGTDLHLLAKGETSVQGNR